MTRLHREEGFTLLELLTVLFIIALIAGMAISELISAEPRYRLVSDALELRAELSATRARALRDHRYSKVCIWVDPTPTDTTAYGTYAELECNDVGSGGCSAAKLACDSTTNATNWAYISNTVDSTNACMASAGQNNGKWCIQKVINFSSDLDKRVQHVSINTIRDGSTRSALASSLVEITYGSLGTISSTYSTATSGVNGYVRMTSFDQCLPSISSCTGFKNNIDVGYSFGGGLRLVE